MEKDGMRHYGVKGMRWGVRKASTSVGTRKAGISKMTDKELAARIRRLRLEKAFSELTPEVKIRGKQRAQSILEDYAQTTLAKFVDAAATLTVKLAMRYVYEHLKVSS